MKDDREEWFSRPAPSLSIFDAVCMLVGIVVGVGIFKAPSMVAQNVASGEEFLLCWIAGAFISLLGALCYAELSTSYPNVGGEYHFLRRAYGRTAGFLFAWGRLSVIQTGAIAMVAFVLGDYVAQLVPLGPYGSAVFAAFAVAALTALNLGGLTQSKRLQNAVTATMVIGIIMVVVAGYLSTPSSPPVPDPPGATSAMGLAMIFVLLTFGGWNEAVYLTAEVRGPRRNMVWILVSGIAVVTIIYLLLNLAYLNVLGLDGVRRSEVVAADLLRATLGDIGEKSISLMVVLAALTTLNATILTGARSSYALGRDFTLFRQLGTWDGRAMTPVNALLIQGAVALLLIGFGAVTRKGFVTMVEYTAPVFWLFFLLSVFSLFRFRQREPDVARPFAVPLYPVTPALFCLVCLYMLHASIAHTGVGALVGIVVLLAGLPLLALSRRLEQPLEAVK